MNLNFKKARDLMVKNQLLPNKINNHDILELFKNTKKENFLTENLKEISYSDIEINLEANRGYLNNLHIAQLIHKADVKEQHKVLHIGALTGYVTKIISRLSKEVVAIESDKFLFKILSQNVDIYNMENVTVVNNEYKQGHISQQPYDIIFIDSLVDFIPETISNQLNDNGGKLISIKKINTNLAKSFSITKNNNSFHKEYYFDSFSESVSIFKSEKKFEF